MKPIEQRIACAKGEILNAMAAISTEQELPASVLEGVVADVLSEIKSQAKIELLNTCNKEIYEAHQEIEKLKEELEKAKKAAKKTLKTEPDESQEKGKENGDGENEADH